MNSKFLKTDLKEVTVELLNEVILFAYKGGHKTHAPLGCSGEDYILFGKSRRKEISLRLHSGDVKLLVTDSVGNFLFYGGFDISLLPISFIGQQYFDIIQNVKHLLDNTSKKSSVTEHDKEQMFKSQMLIYPLISNVIF
jgi:hypothetical protein